MRISLPNRISLGYNELESLPTSGSLLSNLPTSTCLESNPAGGHSSNFQKVCKKEAQSSRGFGFAIEPTI
ncbi:UNVERIFIED_CONTAM: hypothetical protein NCL1_25438 [Trichonephila clavipes]